MTKSMQLLTQYVLEWPQHCTVNLCCHIRLAEVYEIGTLVIRYALLVLFLFMKASPLQSFHMSKGIPKFISPWSWYKPDIAFRIGLHDEKVI